MEPVKEVYRPLGKMLRDNFLGGIAWGLGVTVGLGVVFAILGFVISRIDFVPIIGGFFQQILPYLNPGIPKPPDVILFEQ